MSELKGIFNARELCAILEASRRIVFSAGMAGGHIPVEVWDAIVLDEIDKRWKIDGEGLINRVRELTIYQRACLEIWAGSYWGREEPGDIGKHAKTLE
jgi:hypothetical protein